MHKLGRVDKNTLLTWNCKFSTHFVKEIETFMSVSHIVF